MSWQALDAQIKTLNVELTELYKQLHAGDKTVQGKISTLEVQRKKLEAKSRSSYKLHADLQGAWDYITKDMPKVTETALKKVGSGLTSGLKSIGLILTMFTIIYVIWIVTKK